MKIGSIKKHNTTHIHNMHSFAFKLFINMKLNATFCAITGEPSAAHHTEQQGLRTNSAVSVSIAHSLFIDCNGTPVIAEHREVLQFRLGSTRREVWALEELEILSIRMM